MILPLFYDISKAGDNWIKNESWTASKNTNQSNGFQRYSNVRNLEELFQ